MYIHTRATVGSHGNKCGMNGVGGVAGSRFGALGSRRMEV